LLLLSGSVLLWVVSAIGYGAATWRLLRRMGLFADELGEPHALGLLGLLSLATIGTLLNFVVPLGHWLCAAVLAVGVVLFVADARAWRQRLSWRWLLAWLALHVYVTFFAATEQMWGNFDIGFYQMQTIRWLHEAPAPLGLANLHERFGFNQSWLTVAALTEAPWLIQRSSWIAGTLLFSIHAMGMSSSLWALAAGEVSLAHAFRLGSLWPWLVMMIGEGYVNGRLNVAMPSPDLVVPFLTFATLFYLLRAFELGRRQEALVALCVALFVSTVKLSGAPMVLGAGLSLAAAGGRPRSRRQWASLLGPCAVVGGGFGLPWIARGVVLSGCLAFPARATCFTRLLPWSVSQRSAQATATGITSWARQPFTAVDVTMASWNWFPIWKNRLLHVGVIPPLILIVKWGLPAVVLLTLASREARRGRWDGLVAALLTLAGGFVYWFWLAPDPRFALGYFYSFGILICAFFFVRLLQVPRFASSRNLILLGFVEAMYFWLVSIPAYGEWKPVIPGIAAQPRATDEGRTVFVPTAPDPEQCWDHELPCTPQEHYKQDLRIRYSRRWGRPRAFYLAKKEPASPDY
jgi:hypothetical protein